MRFHWYFSAGDCWVSNDIKEIPATDTVNKVFNNGDRTYDKTHIRPISKDKYHERYCRQEGDVWVYNQDKPQPITATHWYYSAADCYVPVTRYSVPAMDRVNSHDKNGDETELYGENVPPYTVEEYHEKHCNYDSTNNRWLYVN